MKKNTETKQVEKKYGDGKFLRFSYPCLVKKEVKRTREQIKSSLIYIFKTYIGRENSISPYELFQNIYMVEPYSLDVWTRAYWWNVIKEEIRSLRNIEELFVVTESSCLYVLKTKGELNAVNNKLNKRIKSINALKKKAKRWVKSESWKKLN
jgi:DNA-binding Lrp family transcriptional regulator